MKNVMKKSVLVLLLVTGFNAKAADGINVKVKDNQILLVELENVEKGTTLFLMDANGETLFKDSLVTRVAYKKMLDLEVVPLGTYFIHIEMENIIMSSKIVKAANGISIEGNLSEITFKPCFKVLEDKVMVFLSNPLESKITLEVYDKGGQLMNTINHSDSIVKRTLDFSEVPAGEYTINVKMKNRNFQKKINVG